MKRAFWFAWLALAVLGGCSSEPPVAEKVIALPRLPSPPPGTDPLTIFKPGDRILFLGDDLTRQGFYTRAVASALLSIRPEAGLRFYNGGYNGVTSATAQSKAEELLPIVQPTVVFVCVGLNDPLAAAVRGPNRVATDPAATTQPAPQVIAGYKQNLSALVQRLKRAPGVRLVVVLAPPAVQEASLQNERARYNSTYQALTAAAAEIAAAQQAAFGDLYDYSNTFNQSAEGIGVALSFSGNLPNEMGHLVIASVILRGLGVTANQLDRAHWAPLSIRQMVTFRRVWEMPVKSGSDREQAHDLELAETSRDLYDGLRDFDELFFRAWRLAGPDTHPPRAKLLSDADGQWYHLQHLAEAIARQSTDVPPE